MSYDVPYKTSWFYKKFQTAKKFLIAPETQPLFTDMCKLNRMIAKVYLGCSGRTVCSKDAAVELQGCIHCVSCHCTPDTSVSYRYASS